MSVFINKEQELEARIERLETTVNKSDFSGGLEGLLQCKPQVAEEHYGPEPSLYSLLVDYYTEHDMEPEEAISNYIVALKRQAL